MTRNTTRPAVLLVLLASLATLFVVAPAASVVSAAPTSAAQTCTDPYGCPGTTTTTAPPAGTAEPECIVSQNAGRIGVNVDVVITNVPIGIRVNLLLNGIQVDSAVAGGSGSAAATLGSPGDGALKSARSAKSAAQASGLADVRFDFRVPSGPSGSYTLIAVGDGFVCECFPFTILREVAGGNDQNPGRNNGGNLARTGFTVLGLLLVAALLLVLGRAMVEASRRRNRTSAAS